MPPGPPNVAHKPGLHPSGYAVPRVPQQPYAIPTRAAVHGPVGVIPQVPQPGSWGFGAGRGNSTTPIGSHLPHQQSTQTPVGSVATNFGFPSVENANGQTAMGGPLSQPGYISNVAGQGSSLTYRDCFSIGGMSQEFLGDDFKSQGSHVLCHIMLLITPRRLRRVGILVDLLEAF